MGRGTLLLHETVFRSLAHTPLQNENRQRIHDIANKYHRLLTDPPSGRVETITEEGISLEQVETIFMNTLQEPDRIPCWFTVLRYALDHGNRKELHDGFPVSFKGASLWELYGKVVTRAKMTLPVGAWSWLAFCEVGDTVSFCKRLDEGVYEVIELGIWERRAIDNGTQGVDF